MKEVIDYLKKLLSKKERQKIVLANSAGPDSMSLFSLLIKLKKDYNIEIIVAHVNHNVRKESDDEEIFLKNICKKNNIKIEVLEITDYSVENFQNQARKKRYDFFEEVVKKYQADYLFTAHHGDDLIETILMRIVRGSSLKGYSGFLKEVDRGFYKIIRPLIFVSKEEIINYNEENNVSYAIDISNKTDNYTRNRFRNNVLPFLHKEEKNVISKFLKFSEMMEENYLFINKQITMILKKIYNKKGLKIEEFKKEDAFLQRQIIYYLLEKEYDFKIVNINDTHVESIFEIINSKKPNLTINLPNNILITRSYDYLKFDLSFDNIVNNYFYEFNNSISLPNKRELFLVNEEELNNNNILRLNSEEINFPLYVRNRKDGDRMELRNLGFRKIKDIYIDSKIPINMRNIQPLLVDSNNNILWIPGIKKSKYSKKKNEKYDIIIKYN